MRGYPWPNKGFDLDDDSQNNEEQQQPTKEDHLDEIEYNSKQRPNPKQINFVDFDCEN